MLVTALAQLRVAASLALGLPHSPWALDRLMDAALAARAEFGPAAASTLPPTPTLDAAAQAALQLHRFRQQAAAAARTPHYAALFDRLGLDPARLSPSDLPLTAKDALRAAPEAFVRRDAQPVLWAMSTGTTGLPTRVAYSARELRGIIALSALGHLAQGALAPDDVLQVNISTHGALGMLGLVGASARIGALAFLMGVTDPSVALARLADRRALPGKRAQPSVLCTYPSYLGELVERGLRSGYRPGDFGLARIFTGGEVVTAGLKERAQRLFGPVRFLEGYAMSETIPFAGACCSAGHLHFQPLHGLLEVLDPETGAQAAPGAVGTLVATPFPPFRETTPLLRYDTEDLVRMLPAVPTCELAALPATSNILGKRRLAIRHADGWTTQRDVLEALESLDELPLPARCGKRALDGGVAVDVLAPSDSPFLRRRIADALEAQGVPLRQLTLVDDPTRLRNPLPLRGDLREVSFHSSAPAERGADGASQMAERRAA